MKPKYQLILTAAAAMLIQAGDRDLKGNFHIFHLVETIFSLFTQQNLYISSLFLFFFLLNLTRIKDFLRFLMKMKENSRAYFFNVSYQRT